MKNHIESKPTLNRSVLQLKMDINLDISFYDEGKVDLVRNLVERMDLTKLVNSYANKGIKPAVDPITMLELLIYAYSEGNYSAKYSFVWRKAVLKNQEKLLKTEGLLLRREIFEIKTILEKEKFGNLL